MCRSKMIHCYKPHDSIFNWTITNDQTPPPQVKTLSSPKGKKEVKRITFVCESYDSVWLKRFLKRSGVKQKARKQRTKSQAPNPGCESKFEPDQSHKDFLPKMRFLQRRSRSCVDVINIFHLLNRTNYISL